MPYDQPRAVWAQRIGNFAAIAASIGIRAEGPGADDPIVTQYRARQEELIAGSNAILAAADAAQPPRELTVEERNQITANTAEVERLESEVSVRLTVAAQAARMTTPNPRQTSPGSILPDPGPADPQPAPRPQALGEPRPRPRIEPVPRATGGGTWGFLNFGDYAQAVARSSRKGMDPDLRLRNAAASTVSSEGVGGDGGFLVAPDFRTNIATAIFGEDSLMSRTDPQVTQGNQITFPLDMTAPWDATGGIQAYWEIEQGARTQSKVSVEPTTVRLHKLSVLVPVTDELLEDATALGSYLGAKIPEKMDYKVSYALMWGTGVGQPLGFMKSPCLVSVAKENAQTADTIKAENVLKMFARMPVRNRQRAVWLLNPDAETQLPLMLVGTQPAYIVPGGLVGNPYGLLLGRPVIPHQICSTLGDQGDIALCDFGAYIGARKAAGVQQAVSMHLWFDQDLTAFKFTLRFGGQPWWSKAVSPANGSSTLSPFITLDARA